MEIKDSLGELKSNILYTKFVSSSPTNPCKTKSPPVLNMLKLFSRNPNNYKNPGLGIPEAENKIELK